MKTTRKSGNGRQKYVILLLILIVLFNAAILGMLLWLKSNSNSTDKALPEERLDEKLKYGDMLYAQELYSQAVSAYQKVMHSYKLPPERAAALAYRMGEIYLDKLRQPEEALSAFILAEYHDSQEKLSSMITKRKVECLERLQRSNDARRALEKEATLTEKDRSVDASEVIAEIGSSKITVKEFEHYQDQLPEEVKSKFKGQAGTLQLLQQFIATELIYKAAQRKGYLRQPDLTRAIKQFEKNLLVQQFIKDELGQSIMLKPSDVELYYQAHKSKYGDKKFEKVQQQVARDLQNQKFQEALGTLFERLSKAENVKLYPDKLK